MGNGDMVSAEMDGNPVKRQRLPSERAFARQHCNMHRPRLQAWRDALDWLSASA